jgi:hypothetical protein
MTNNGRDEATVEKQNESTEEADTEKEESTEEVDFEDHPIGTSPDDVMGTVEQIDDGALPEVISKYEPEQFTSLLNGLIDEYQISRRRKYKYNLFLVITSIILVLSLFGGLLWFTINTDTSGGALIFFAGTLAGYFMRLASELS